MIHRSLVEWHLQGRWHLRLAIGTDRVYDGTASAHQVIYMQRGWGWGVGGGGGGCRGEGSNEPQQAALYYKQTPIYTPQTPTPQHAYGNSVPSYTSIYPTGDITPVLGNNSREKDTHRPATSLNTVGNILPWRARTTT